MEFGIELDTSQYAIPSEDFRLALLDAATTELRVHFLTEATKRLKVLSAVAKEILEAGKLGKGGYKIEFELGSTTTDGIDVPFTQSLNTMFVSDGARVIVDDGVVRYGVKSPHSSMYKLEKQVVRQSFLDRLQKKDPNDERTEALRLLEEAASGNFSLNQRDTEIVADLKKRVDAWIGIEARVKKEVMPQFFDPATNNPQAKADKIMEKLNGIVQKITEKKKERAEKLSDLQDRFMGNMYLPMWPLIPPPNMASWFAAASKEEKRHDDFAIEYLKLIASSQYKGALAQTNYEPIYGAMIWARKLVEEGTIKDIGGAEQKMSTLAQKVRALEKKIRVIPIYLGKSITPYARYRFFCELQKCRFEALSAIKDASNMLKGLEREPLTLVQNELARIARNISAMDFESERKLCKKFGGLGKYSERLGMMREQMVSEKKQIDEVKKKYREDWTALEIEFLDTIKNELAPISPIHAHVLNDVYRQIKRHIRFKQGDWLEPRLESYFTPESVLMAILYLLEQKKLPWVDSKLRESGVKKQVGMLLDGVTSINSKIEQLLDALGINKKEDMARAQAIGYIEAAYHDLKVVDGDIRHLLGNNSTDTKIKIKYNEVIERGSPDKTKNIEVFLTSEYFRGSRQEQEKNPLIVEIKPAMLKAHVAEIVLESESGGKRPFEHMLFGEPYSKEGIRKDFGWQESDYLLHVKPLVEGGIKTIAQVERGSFENSPEARLATCAMDGNRLNGTVVKSPFGGLLENPAHLLFIESSHKGTGGAVHGNRKNEITEMLMQTDRGGHTQMMKDYVKAKKLFTLHAMAGVIHMNKFNNLGLSLKQLQKR